MIIVSPIDMPKRLFAALFFQLIIIMFAHMYIFSLLCIFALMCNNINQL